MMNINYKPPIMYMLIDTDNKSIKQIEHEIISKVDIEIEKQLSKYKNELSEVDYKTIVRKLAIERNKIVDQFMFQIRHRREINKKVIEELKEVEIA